METVVEFVFLVCQRQESDLLHMPYEGTALPMSYAGFFAQYKPSINPKIL